MTASATRRVAAAAAELAESNTIARAADKRVHRYLPTQLWQFFQVRFRDSLSFSRIDFVVVVVYVGNS